MSVMCLTSVAWGYPVKQIENFKALKKLFFISEFVMTLYILNVGEHCLVSSSVRALNMS